MIPDPAAAGTDCIALAVAFLRAPSQFPDLLHGRRHLPPGVTTLLLVAAGNSFTDDAAAALGIPADELERAALFFIGQVLLAHNANPSRSLGLEPGAGIDEIKEHHRLLMRLFHPDRQTAPDERSDAIATRINQAYNVLRSPDARAAYDLTLTEMQTAKPLVRHYPRRPHFEHAPDLPMHPPSFIRRHRTLFALGSVALAAALGVMLVYINRVPTGAIGTSDSHSARAVEDGAPRLPKPELPPAIARVLAESGPLAPPPGALPAVAGRPEERPERVAESVREREPVAMPAAVKTTSARQVPAPAAAPAHVPERLPPPPPPAAALPGAIGTPVAVNPPAVPEIKAAPLRPDQLNGLVANLAEQYQRGDLENLLALFDASARIERGDKKQIRAEYGELFRNSENRTLYIWDVVWSGDGRVTRGEGSFQARVLRKGDYSPRIYSGAVTIEVIQRNDRPLIVGLYHKADH
jgi:hypothetical protein